MAENKYANAKCFILSPDGYEEITYSELCRRRDIDETYKDKKFIPLHGMHMEVTPQQYGDFYRTRNGQRYLDKRSAEKGDISIDMLSGCCVYDNLINKSLSVKFKFNMSLR